MKKAVIFPFLFGLYVILNLLITNLDQLDPSQSLRPLGILLLAIGVVIVVLWAVFRDWHYSAYLTWLALVLVFLPAHVSRVVLDPLPVSDEQARLISLAGVGAILVPFSLRKVWLRLGGAARLTPFLNLVFALALLTQAIFTLPRWPGYLESLLVPPTAAKASQPQASFQIDCSERPDIYYIVMDAYGREDVLDRMYGVDNTAFLESLESKGFFVARQARSNYIQTIYSLSSSLNFTFIGPEPRGVSGRDYFTQKISNNHMMQLLKTCGYQTVTFDTGFFFTNNVNADLRLADGPPLSEFESLLLSGTPLESTAAELNHTPPAQSYDAHRSRVQFVLDELKRLPRQPGPKFVFAHILSPHPPFVFSADGTPVQPSRSYSTADGNEFSGSQAEYRQGYAAQVQFINRQLEETLDAILAESSTPPIIILQGDHGPGSTLDWGSPNRTCLWERTGILNAYYLPGGSDQLYASITPVNSFRVVLNTYFGTDLELLPDRTYFTSQRMPRRTIEVTGKAGGCGS